MSPDQCLILFVRFPEKGRVKTRLAEDIGLQNAMNLYKCFVLDLLEKFGKDDFSLIICSSPPDAGEAVQKWLGKRYTYMLQRGRDLGERMKNAFQDVFRNGFGNAVLVGTDIPDISYALIKDALSFHNYDAVIGPAHDGGYYLIGFRQDTFLPEIFDGISWGTERVFETTMAIFTKNNYAVHILPTWRDVDRIKDLKALYKRNIKGPFAGSRTMGYLLKKQDLVR